LVVNARIINVQLEPYNAKGDGKADDTNALTKATNDANTNDVIYVPEGKYMYTKGLTYGANKRNVSMVGDGQTKTILYCTSQPDYGVWMQGDGTTISELQITKDPQGRGPGKESAFHSTASNFIVEKITIIYGAAAMIMYSANNGVIRNNMVLDSQADGIHMSDGSSFITVEHNCILRAHDDSIATVGRVQDGKNCFGNIYRYNHAAGYVWGRGMSVAGGENILIHDNWIDGSDCGTAGILITVEGPCEYGLYNVNNVTVKNNLVVSAGGSTHPCAIFGVPWHTSYDITNVVITNNTIVKPQRDGVCTNDSPCPGPNCTNPVYPGKTCGGVVRNWQATNNPIVQSANYWPPDQDPCSPHFKLPSIINRPEFELIKRMRELKK